MARWFTAVEITGLDPRLVEKLDFARTAAGVPFKITSGRRTREANAAAGGVGASAHIRGLGVDLAAPSSGFRYAIVTGLIAAGFTRIGVYDRHVHADIDPSLPPRVMWVGASH
jgi:hypothetical protein